MFAMKKIPPDEFKSWETKYKKVLLNVNTQEE